MLRPERNKAPAGDGGQKQSVSPDQRQAYPDAEAIRNAAAQMEAVGLPLPNLLITDGVLRWHTLWSWYVFDLTLGGAAGDKWDVRTLWGPEASEAIRLGALRSAVAAIDGRPPGQMVMPQIRLEARGGPAEGR